MKKLLYLILLLFLASKSYALVLTGSVTYPFTFTDGGLAVADHVNTHIHNGTLFKVTDYVSSFAKDETSAYLLVPCTSDSQAILYRVSSSAMITIKFYEGNDTVSNGTELSVKSLNRNFPDDRCMRVFRKAIVVDNGTLLKSDLVLADKSYGGIAESLEWILDSSKNYVIILTGTVESYYLFELYFHD